MGVTEAYVPLDILIDSELNATAKLIIALLILDRHTNSSEQLLSPTRLANRTSLSRTTIKKSLARISSSKWAAICAPPSDQLRELNRSLVKVRIPEDLLTEGAISPQARIMYGVLQGLRSFHRGSGSFTYRGLARICHNDRRTVASAIVQLAESGWISINDSQRQSGMIFRLQNPVIQSSERAIVDVERRINNAPFLGEALMREYLTLIVDSDEFEDNAAPGFLVNPLTGERLQFDRFYPPAVAFEFNGPQHYGATEKYSAKDATMQRARDLMKTGICVNRGITLVVAHPQDLTLKCMQGMVGSLLPQRDIRGDEPLVKYLETVSRSYRRWASRIKIRADKNN